ncbi:MAG: hypothetical protein KDB23_26910 [Planctomycetales bacterium]|nr:hypothetical protein [Planctomycetales bacterium]
MKSEGGEIWCRRDWASDGDKVVVNLEADQVISGGRVHEGTPSITLAWIDSPFAFDRLVGRTVSIPKSYDERVGDHMTTFYHDEHQDFNDVTIKFVESDGEQLRLIVTGKTEDLYAEGMQTVDIEIDTVVRLYER